ncbi:MAG: hypothetical protein HKN47_18275 [Pirellulaceae bacterium]|nr:hypothetical protein [Pirellulaceae bacterium]
MQRLLTYALLTLIAAKVAILVSPGPAAINGDAQGYWELSSFVLQGDVLMLREPIAFRTPVYPWFLAAVRLLPWPLLVITIIQGALYVASVAMAGYLASRISRHRSAMILTLLIMLPAVSAITFIGDLVTETLFVFLLMLNLVTVDRYAQNPTKKVAALAGLTFALTLLTRPIVIMLWVAHLAFVAATHLSRKTETDDAPSLRRQVRSLVTKDRLLHVALAGAVVLAMASPWLARNNHLFGKTFLTEFVGRNVWIVTFQDGSGAGLSMPTTQSAREIQERIGRVHPSGDWHDSDWRHTWTVSDALVQSGLNDPQADRLMKSVAIDAMKQDKSTVAYKAIRRIVNFWRSPATQLEPPQPDYQGFDDYPATWSLQSPMVSKFATVADDYRISQSVLGNTVVMAIIGCACVFLVINTTSRPWGIWISLILAYFCTITGLLEIPDYRYRLVVEPIAAMAVGSALAIGWGRFGGLQPDLSLQPDLIGEIDP